jgi:hypothetical protein
LIKLSSDIPLGLHELDLDSQLLRLFRHSLSNLDEKLVLERRQSDSDFLSHRGGHRMAEAITVIAKCFISIS